MSEKIVWEIIVRNKGKEYKDQRTFKRFKYRSDSKIKIQVFLGTKTYFFLLKSKEYLFLREISITTTTTKSLQSSPTLCDPIDGSPPGSTIPGILQARTLEWIAISFSNAWKWKVNKYNRIHLKCYHRIETENKISRTNKCECA